MKIDPVSRYNALEAYNVKKTPSGPKADRGAGDKVDLSGRALDFSKMFTKLKEDMKPAPGEAARKAELALKIEAGEYKVDSKELAGKILKQITGK